jgi:hypothetical protein
MQINDTISKEEYLKEKAKLQDDYLKAEIDYSIGACQESPAVNLVKAGKLRNGDKDLNDYAYLKKAYGIEFPAKLAHIPIMKTMFDALLGIEQSDPMNFSIAILNKEGIDYINDFIRKRVLNEVFAFVDDVIAENVQRTFGENQNKPVSRKEEKTIIDRAMSQIQEKYHDNFKTDLQIYGTDMLQHLREVLSLKLNFSLMFDDLITYGQEFYQIEVRGEGLRPVFKVIHPEDIYFSKPRHKKFINTLDRVVVKEKTTVTDVLALYGDKLTKDEISELICEHVDNMASNVNVYDMRYMDQLIKGVGKEGFEKLSKTYVDTYYVEWKANTEVEYEEPRLVVDSRRAQEEIKKDKHKGYRLDLYKGIRIGENKYVDMGKVKYAIRPADAPWDVKLSINGALYSDRNGKPFSLVLSTESLAEKYDILHYHWESLVAMSGGKAVLVDYADIPEWMGTTEIERTMKWLGYLKQGVGMIDSSQTKGRERQFNNMGDVDLSLSNSISTITELLRYIEELASRITGVNRQILGQMMERDGKATSELAIASSSVVTRPLFFLHREVCKQAMTDLLNASRYCYKKGLTAAYTLGNYGQRIFTVDGDKFNLAHYNVHLVDWQDEKELLGEVKSLSIEFIKQQLVDAEDALDMNTINSVSRLVQVVKNSIRRKKNDKTQEMQGQLEQATNEIDKLNQVIEKLKAQSDASRQKELEINQFKVSKDAELKEKELADKKEVEHKKLANDSKRIELESLQLHLGGKSNMEVRNK